MKRPWWSYERETAWDWMLGLGPGLRLHYRRHETPVPDGGGHSGPERRLYQQCCRCGRFRILGKFVEMYGALLNGWWYECLDCALASMTRIVEARTEPPHEAFMKEQGQ